MEQIQIKIYKEIIPEIKEIFQKFIPENFTEINFKDPEVQAEMAEWYWNPAQIHLIAYIGNEVVGVAHITKRTTTVKDQEISLACLGGLVVSKNHSGQGIARRLIEERLKIAKEWNVDIAFLNTKVGKLGKMFFKFGFVLLGHSYSFKGKSGKIIEDDSGMIAAVSAEEKFNLVLNDTAQLYIGEGNL